MELRIRGTPGWKAAISENEFENQFQTEPSQVAETDAVRRQSMILSMCCSRLRDRL